MPYGSIVHSARLGSSVPDYLVNFLRVPTLVNAVHSRTLQRALETVGTKERLATALGVPLGDLEAYMVGTQTVPTSVFIAALDIVAHRSGPHRKPES